MNILYLDVDTHDIRNIMRRLSSLKTTHRIDNDGEYHQCRECSRIYLETTLTLDEVDHRYVCNGKLAVYGVCEAPKRPSPNEYIYDPQTNATFHPPVSLKYAGTPLS